MGITDLCVDNGGAWCTIDVVWSDGGVVGQFVVIAIPVLVLVLLAMIVQRTMRAARSFAESRKGDL